MGRRRSALLWGAVGMLTFLVGVQAYLLAGGRVPLSPVAIGGVGAAVAAVVTGVAYAVEPRLLAKGRS